MATEPADNGQSLSRLKFPDLLGVGAKTHPDLQRRLLANLWKKTSRRHGSGFQRVLGFGLAGYWGSV